MTNYDTLALSVLLSSNSKAQKKRALNAILRRARRNTACPECGYEGPHEQNEDGSVLLCTCCGLSFE